MPEDEKNQSQKDGKDSKITVTVDRSAEIEALQAELAKAKIDADTQRKEAEKLSKEKADLEQVKTNTETEKEDLKAKLEAIAEKEFNAKKDAVLKRVTGVFSKPEDAERAKEITARLNDPEKGPENLRQTEYMINILEENIKKGKEEQEAKAKAEEEKKKAAEAAGEKKAPKGGETATLNQQQTGGAGAPPAGNKGTAYESEEAMIRDLKQRSLDPRDPAKQAEAKAILNQLWKKWGIAIKKDYDANWSTENAKKSDYEPSAKTAEQEGEIKQFQNIRKNKEAEGSQ